MIAEYPEEFQASLRKNEILDKHLKDVYVTSHDVRHKIKFCPMHSLTQYNISVIIFFLESRH